MSVRVTVKELDMIFKLFVHNTCNTYKSLVNGRKKISREDLLGSFEKEIDDFLYFSSSFANSKQDSYLIISKIRLRLEYFKMQYECHGISSFLVQNKEFINDFVEPKKAMDIGDFLDTLVDVVKSEEKWLIDEITRENDEKMGILG